MAFRYQDSYRFAPWLERDVEIDERVDGSMIIRSRVSPRDGEPHLPAYLRRHATERPDATMIARRAGPAGDWYRLSYGQAREKVDALTQALLNLDIGGDRPLLILSENSIEQMLITLAAMQANIPVSSISPNYSLLSQDHEKVKQIAATLRPTVLFVQNAEKYRRAVKAITASASQAIFVIHVDAPVADIDSLGFADLVKTPTSPDVDASIARIVPDATAKYMFTSGSTGSPKAVIQTHRVLARVVSGSLQAFDFDPDNRPVRLDWAPWSHVMGATSLMMSIGSGGIFYIDDGKPVEPFLSETLRNLKEISTTTYANVPAGYAAIVAALEADRDMARTFFANLEHITYAGARLSDDVAKRLQAVAIDIIGHKVPLFSGFGSTETGPMGTYVYWPSNRAGLIGLPSPGVEVKLLPLGDERYEIRIRGESVMPGYLEQPELNAAIFDDERFFKIGDAVMFADAQDPLEGLMFAGRISEEFKLQTGTFVRVGALRSDVIEATAPMLRDLVICGDDQPFVAILAWPNLEEARKLIGADATLADAARSPVVRKAVASGLAAHNARVSGSSRRVRRFLLLDTPASLDNGEQTDKGSINAKAVQRNRANLIAELFASTAGGDVVEVSPAD